MAFGKITKQDLIDAGLDPDKLKEFQEQGVSKTDLTTLKSELSTTMTDLIKASFTELEGKLKPQPTVRTEGGGDDKKVVKTPEELQMEEQNEFLTDPAGFVKKQVGSVEWRAALEFKKMSRSMAYKDASKELRGFKNQTIREEIEKEWEKYTPEILVRNNGDPSLLIKQIHDMILGKHHDEIVLDTNKKDGKFNMVQGSSGGGTVSLSSGGGDTNVPEITAEEQAIAKKFGFTDAEWIEQGKQMDDEMKQRTIKVGA